MKKKLLSLAITGIMSITALFGGCGLSGSDNKIIDTISSIHDPIKGVTSITITYVDDLYNPDYFEIPDGIQGDVGYTGNGIQKIETIEKTENEQTKRYMLISYTDGTQFEVPIYDGVDGSDGKAIDRVEQQKNIDGSVSIIICYSDGTQSDPIAIPGGRNGDKIVMEIPEVQEDGSTKIVFTVSDHWNIPTQYELFIPKGEQGNSIEYVYGSMSSDGTEYILNVKIEGKDEPNSVSFPRPTALLTGSKKPVDDDGDVKGDGIDGDMYYNTSANVFYRKINGVWKEVLSFENSTVSYSVEFSSEALINGAKVAIEIIDGYDYYTKLKPGTFYSNGIEIPKASLPSNFATDKTYEFKGWYTSKQPNFATQSAFTDLTVIASDMVLYPVFVEVSL